MLLIEPKMRSRIRSLWPVAAVLALAVLLPAGRSEAQALSTAGRSAAIFVWGGGTFVQPDYGPDQYKNWGYTFGANYDRYIRLYNRPYSVGFEFRYGKTTGTIVDESTMAGGIRAGTTIYSRIHPWVNFLFGVGNINFNYLPVASDPNYTTDRGRMFEYGFGIDIDVYKNWSLKLDGQEQSWNCGINANGPLTLGPAAYTAAIVYRIPFRSYIGAQPHRREKLPPEPPPPPPAPVVTTTTTTDTTTTTAPAPDTTAPATAAPATEKAAPAAAPATDNTAPAAAPPANTPPPADNSTPPAQTAPPATGTSNPPQG